MEHASACADGCGVIFVQAAGSGQILCVMELIKAGLKYPIDVTDKKGWTPLHKTAIWNCPEEAE